MRVVVVWGLEDMWERCGDLSAKRLVGGSSAAAAAARPRATPLGYQ